MADSLFSAVPHHEKLPQINLLRLFAIQRIGNDFVSFFKDHGTILAGEPAAHALFEFRHAHAITVALVLDQLVIQFGEKGGVVKRGKPVFHEDSKASQAHATPFSSRICRAICADRRAYAGSSSNGRSSAAARIAV